MVNNHKMAMKRLQNTEKRLLTNPDVMKAYDEVIDQYLDKGYIRKVPVSEKQPDSKWYLPRFAILTPNNATAKIRIVFDVAAKSRVAPLAAMSIPRMEMMEAVTGLRFAISVANALQVSVKQVKFWCDSMNTLWWIRGHSRSFKPFVANRVGDIQNMTSPEQWRSPFTKDNPADYLTRGMAASAFTCNEQ